MARPLSLGMLKKSGTEPWLYEALKALIVSTKDSQAGLAAINRGEAPNGSGQPLTPDLAGFFKLAGRHPGQVGFGGTNPGDTLTLGSTFAGVKGKIFLGTPTANLTVDEVQSLVGINITSPLATFHLVGSIAGTGGSQVPSSNVNVSWESRGGGTWAIIGTPLWQCANTDDGVTSMAVHHAAANDNPQKLGLGTIIPGASYTVTYRAATLGAAPIYGGGNSNVLWCSLVDSVGNEWMCTEGLNAPFTEILTPSPDFYTIVRHVTCSGTPFSTGNTPNAVWSNAQAQTSHFGGGDLYFGVTLVTVTQVNGSPLARWDFFTGTQSGGIDSLGHFGIGTGNAVLTAMLNTFIDSGGTVGFLLKGAASQVANLIQVTSSTGAIVAGLDAAGSHFGDNHSVAYDDDPVYYNDDMVWY